MLYIMRSVRLGGRPGMGTPLLAAIFLLCHSALAIYEDQVGKYDWIKQHVGVIRHVEVSALPQPCIYVASATNVVAALDPDNGLVLWRKLLDEEDTVHALAARAGVLVALSSDRHVRAFGSAGQLLWEALLPTSGPGTSRADIRIVPGSKGSLLVAARGGAVLAYSLKSGRQAWSVDVPVPSQPGAAAVHGDEDRGEVLVAFIDEGGETVTSARMSAADGSLLERASAGAGGKLDLENLAVLPAGIVAVSADGARVCSGAVADAAPLSCRALGSPAAAGAVSLKRGSCAGHVVVQSAVAVLFKVEGAALTPVKPSKPGGGASGCFAGRDGAPVVAVATAGDAGLELGVVSAGDGTAVKQHADASLLRVAVGGATLGVAGVFGVAIDGEPGALVQLEEGSLALVGCAPGARGAAWVRHEALASITDVLFADLPAPTPQNEAEWAAGQPSLSERLRMQLLALKAQVGLALPPEQAELALHAALTSDRLRPTRDADGFRRQLLVATSAGKVASLHTGDGRTLWALDFGAAAAPQRLAPWRTPHDMRHDEEVVALRAGPTGVVATVINTRTGQVVSTDTVAAAAAAEVLPLPKPTHNGRVDQYVYAVAPADGAAPAAVLPQSAEGRAAFAAQSRFLTHWRVDEEAGAVEGLGFAPDGTRRLLWSVAAAPRGSGLRILAAAARDSTEAVYAAARAVAGGRIKLKHLSPNTLVVVAGPPPERPPSPSSRLVVTLLEAASGRVLFTQTHQGASGPVHATVTENSAIYHYWSAKRERWEIGSVDAYEEPPPGLTVGDLALGRGAAASAANASSWDPQPLQFDSQTFLCKLPAATLGVTKTAHGTTARMVLIGTPEGQVYMADRRLLDPRRPVIAPGAKPTPEQLAEGLPPYQPELTVLGPSFATLDRRVARLHTVATAPAVLESASLMVAAGLDLFYSRLQPSRGFDMVPDDFPHALLVAVVMGMAAAAVGMRTVLQQRALKLKWQ